MLAERARLHLAMVVLPAASLAIPLLAGSPAPCARPPAVVVSAVPPPGAVEVSDFCPPHVREAIHLGAEATLSCVRGQFPEPGTFVFAQYQTTEAWERFAVVADDGQLLVPMLDRPRR